MQRKIIYFGYIAIIVCILGLLFSFQNIDAFRMFFQRIEQNSFDARQKIVSSFKQHNKDIVLLSIDDQTYEYIMDKYGEWPISRMFWSRLIDNVEQVKPKVLIFDLLFFKPNTSDVKGDMALVKSVEKYDNIYLSMIFDYTSPDVRPLVTLPDNIKLRLNQDSDILRDNQYIAFSNTRPVMKQLSDITSNIGAINVTRDNDGILRNMTPILKYQNDYYPNLTFRAAIDMLDIQNISIKNNKILLDDKYKISLDGTSRAILNWYGPSYTFLHIPVWRVDKAIKEKDTKFLADNFKDKIVYIGTTSLSLYDIKSTPIDSNVPGVECHATFLNNILDNNFINKLDFKIDFLISILVSVLIGYLVLNVQSVPRTLFVLFVVLTNYWIISLFLMHHYNIWCSVVLPFVAGIITFVLVYCLKYFLKARDYEKTYKLAVTDGLTQLYNHRYFQEQLISNINNFERYETKFSLLLIDIDFFKKFNDTYGHQSGDLVLIQVANILKKNSRTSDIVCRYGGEEMAIILTNTDKKDAIITANKICHAIRNYQFVLVNNKKVNVTISTGVATIGENGLSAQDLIAYSDKCLYKAKAQGRDQVVFEA